MTQSRRRLPLHVESIVDVAERQLCTGCGACAYLQPGDIRMVDDLDAGRRPVVRTAAARPGGTDRALACCPGVGLAHAGVPAGAIPEVFESWGPVLEVWEGFAASDDVRFAGSSGGAATALAAHALDVEGFHGVLHIRAREDTPYLNETTMSTTRDELLAATGSRYAPASPCDRLDWVRDAPGPSVFIGKPCDVAATAMIRSRDAELDRQLGLTIGIFCAGTPTTRGTLAMLEAMGIDDPDEVSAVRYRGHGWPGAASVQVPTEDGVITRELSYDESWGQILQRHRQWRCYVCADHTGEFADIAVGDPWYRDIEEGELGRSLLVVRTERGRSFLRAAIAHGALIAEPVPADRIAASQPGLLRVRGSVWGRVVASVFAGIPAPRYEGIPTFPAWRTSLSLLDKLRSIFGLFRRIKRKGLWERHPVTPFDPDPRTRPEHPASSWQGKPEERS